MKYYGRNQLGEISLDNKDHFHNPYPKEFRKSIVPEGTSGEWSVKKFIIGEEAGLHNLRLIRDGRRDRIVPMGSYTKLVHNKNVIMSDTPAEAHEHHEAYKAANGNVLINGLGLGFFLQAVLIEKFGITSITVIEKSIDVINLVAPSFKNKKVKIIHGDAFTFKPPAGTIYDFIWHDIWTYISENNRKEIRKLERRYAKYTKEQSSWSKEYM